jgi:hypothetical protein
MLSNPLIALRRPPRLRAIAWGAALALLLAGFAQASHFHKDERAHATTTHLQCLLCLHVDRWGGPPDPPRPAPPTLGLLAPIVTVAASIAGREIPHAYHARGPP